MYPFGLLDTSLETMLLFTVQRFWPIGRDFHVADTFRWLGPGEAVLFGPTEETAECSKSSIDGRRSSWRDVFLLECFEDCCKINKMGHHRIFSCKTKCEGILVFRSFARC